MPVNVEILGLVNSKSAILLRCKDSVQVVDMCLPHSSVIWYHIEYAYVLWLEK